MALEIPTVAELTALTKAVRWDRLVALCAAAHPRNKQQAQQRARLVHAKGQLDVQQYTVLSDDKNTDGVVVLALEEFKAEVARTSRKGSASPHPSPHKRARGD